MLILMTDQVILGPGSWREREKERKKDYMIMTFSISSKSPKSSATWNQGQSSKPT